MAISTNNATPPTAGELKRRAWSAVEGRTYWLFAGADAALSFSMKIVAAASVVTLLFAAIGSALAFTDPCGGGGAAMFATVTAAAAAVSVPLLYAVGFTAWGAAKIALSAARGGFAFRHALSGWGHGWRMTWLILVETTYLQFWLLLFIVPGVVKVFSYALSHYVAIDHPDWTADRCITESRRLMYGHKWRYFRLCLGFVGWYALAAAASVLPMGGLASSFLAPYAGTAFALFYEERRNNAER